MTQTDHNFSNFCREAARRDDPDRYLASLFAPRSARPHLWALIAFYQEIAKTREVVTETTIGLIRLQWWRDEIAKIYLSDSGGQAGDANPILAGLRAAIAAHNLPQDEFNTLIYAREFDLENVPPENMQGLENYVDYTNTPLNMLIARVCRADVDRERVRYLSVAYGFVGVLRSVVFHAAQTRCYLPSDELAKYGITSERLYSHNSSPLRREGRVGVMDLRLLVKDIAGLATEHLTRATEINHVRPFRAMRALTNMYLKQLKSVDYDVSAPKLARPPMFKELRVWLGSLSN